MVRCLLHEKGLSKVFWAKATNTAVFFHNQLPTRILEEKTPFKAWFGYKPSLSFLKIFDSMWFVHVPKFKRDKLDNRAISGIFLVYSSFFKAYKIYHPQTQKTKISRDVHFHENEQWNWKDSHTKKMVEDQTHSQNELVDDSLVRGTKSLVEIYQRSNVVVCEPNGYEEAHKDLRWQRAMEEEISMIQKNST